MSRCAISSANASRIASRAESALSPGTEKQIECSDEAWEMSETEMRARCMAAKVRAAIPGTPSIPLPVTVTSANPVMPEMAFTGYSRSVRRRETSVPIAAGSAKGRIRRGMLRSASGIRARGCRTLAP